MRGQRPTNEQITAMRKRRAEGATVRDIGQDFPFAEKTILRHVADIPFTHRNGQKLPPGAEVLRLVESGMSRREIAMKFDVTDSAVCNVIKKAGLAA